MPSNAVMIFAAAALVTWCVNQGVLVFINWRRRLRGPTSSVVATTPRYGGIGIVAGMVVGFCIAWSGGTTPYASLLGAIVLVAVIGLADDLGFKSIVLRLVVQFAAAGLLVASTGGFSCFPLPAPLDFPLGAWAVPVAMFWLVSVTNIYNFLDGMDGFAALQGTIAGLGMACWEDSVSMSSAALGVAGAACGFLPHNWHPAKMWMGDSGAPTVGFTLAALPLLVDPGLRTNAVIGVAICLWFFLADGSFTLLRRICRRDRFWERHYTHHYQRLVQAGVRQDRMALAVMGTATVLIVASVVSHRIWQSNNLWLSLFFGVILFYGYRAAALFHEGRQRIALVAAPAQHHTASAAFDHLVGDYSDETGAANTESRRASANRS